MLTQHSDDNLTQRERCPEHGYLYVDHQRGNVPLPDCEHCQQLLDWWLRHQARLRLIHAPLPVVVVHGGSRMPWAGALITDPVTARVRRKATEGDSEWNNSFSSSSLIEDREAGEDI